MTLKQNFARKLPETIHLTYWLLGRSNHGELKILSLTNTSIITTSLKLLYNLKIRHTQNFSLGRGGRVTLRLYIILFHFGNYVIKTVSYT